MQIEKDNKDSAKDNKKNNLNISLLGRYFEEDIDIILEKFTDAEKDKERWNAILDEAYGYIYPDHISFTQKAHNSEITNKTIWNTTALIALEDAADQLQYYLMPPQLKWATIEYKDIDLTEKSNEEKLQERNALDKIESFLFTHIHRSNADEVIYKALKDLMISTSVVLVTGGRKDQLLNYINIHFKYICYTAYSDGTEKDVFYTQYLTKDQLKTEYDYDISRIDNSDRGNNHEYKIVSCYMTKQVKSTEKKINDKIYIHLYVILYNEKKVISEKILGMMPFVISKLDQAPNERYGRGIVLKRLADIRKLNKISHYASKSINLKYAGSYIEDHDLQNSIIEKNDADMCSTIVPDEMALKNKSISELIHPVPPSFFDIKTMARYEEEVESLKKSFSYEPLGDISVMGGKLTATEVSIRQNAFIKKQSGMSSRLENQFSKKFLNLSLYQISISDKDTELQKILKANDIEKVLNVTFKSQIHKIEKQEKFQQLLQFVQSVAQVSPQALNTKLDIDNIIDEYAEFLDINTNVMLSDEKKQLILEQLQNMSDENNTLTVNPSKNRQNIANDEQLSDSNVDAGSSDMQNAVNDQ